MGDWYRRYGPVCGWCNYRHSICVTCRDAAAHRAPEQQNVLVEMESEITMLRRALRGVGNGECWCGVGVGDPRLVSHSEACQAARLAMCETT